ncbi:hypothetical protein D3C73_1418750 [compost metagenome]
MQNAAQAAHRMQFSLFIQIVRLKQIDDQLQHPLSCFDQFRMIPIGRLQRHFIQAGMPFGEFRISFAHCLNGFRSAQSL